MLVYEDWMKAKVLIAAFLLVFAATMPVLAQGNGNGGGDAGQTEEDDADENEDDGGTTNADDGNDNSGNSGRDDNSNTDNSNNGNGNKGDGNGVGASDKPSTREDLTVVPEADLLQIVKAGQAVSLGSLLPNVQQRTGGEIIDAQLVRTDRALIYAVKVLTPDGRVGMEYYDAHSGTHIEAQ